MVTGLAARKNTEMKLWRLGTNQWGVTRGRTDDPDAYTMRLSTPNFDRLVA